MSIPESRRPAAVLSSPHETRLCFFQPSMNAENGPRIVSHWIERAQAVVSATSLYRNHTIASEIASRFRGQMSGSQWIEHAQAVVSATLVYQDHAITSQIASENGGQLLESHWIEHAQVVVSSTLVYQNHAIASKIASQVVV